MTTGRENTCRTSADRQNRSDLTSIGSSSLRERDLDHLKALVAGR
jgi:hypothetical protein